MRLASGLSTKLSMGATLAAKVSISLSNCTILLLKSATPEAAAPPASPMSRPASLSNWSTWYALCINAPDIACLPDAEARLAAAAAADDALCELLLRASVTCSLKFLIF